MMQSPPTEIGVLAPKIASTSGSWLGEVPQFPERIPSLDGIRAISILLVVLAHSMNPTLHPKLYDLFGHMGNYGVRIFFLISGFLITELLLKESSRFGTISLKNFYMRRIIRICPAFYVYVGVVFALASFGMIRLLPGDLLHTLTYTMNYHLVRAWYLNHTWSLSVEEQFYLLWPAILLLWKPSRALRIALAVIAITPFTRMLMYFVLGSDASALSRHFEAICDAVATGCLLAGVYNRLGQVKIYKTMQAWRLYILIPVFLILLSAATFKMGAGIYYVAGQTIANIGGILLLDYVVRFPKSAFGTLLNTRPFAAIGRWSYSIYLWQELLLDYDKTGLNLPFPLNLLCLAGASLASYYGIEVQFMKLRKRFAVTRPDLLPCPIPASR